MFENDYIMRVIAQVGVMVRAMLAKLALKDGEAALETSRDALQLLLGLPPGLADSLTADGFVALLSPSGAFDPKRGRLTAEVLVLRARAHEVSGDEIRAASERAKAQRVIALVLEHGDDEDRAEAEALLEQLGDSPAR